MKHIRIVLTLTIVVLVSSLGVYFVEDVTTPIITEYNIKQANAAKFEVLPTLESTDAIVPEEDYDYTGTSITELIIVEDKGYIYTAEFQGFQSVITYMVGIDLDGKITGYKTLIQGDTPGLGALIADDGFYEQFIGLSTDDAASGNFDGLAGATITTGGLIGSLDKLIEFHNVEFEGAVVETPEQRLTRLKEEITEVGADFSDDSADYDLTSSPISKVETTGNIVVYTAVFAGYTALQGDGTPDIVYLVAFDLTTNDIIGFRVIEQYETVGLGSVIEDEVFQEQFDDLSQDAIDDIAGTTAVITLGGLKTSLEDVVEFHQAEFEGEEPETDAQKLVRFKEEITVVDAGLTDASGDYDLTTGVITKVEMADDGSEDVAVIYTVEFVGYNTSDVIEYIISFDLETNDILGFRVIYQNETPGYGDAIEDDDYYLQFVGMAQIDALNGDIDAVAGTSDAPITMGAFKDSLNEVVTFHKLEFEGVVVETDDERLLRLWLELFPNAVDMDDFIEVTRDYAAHYDIEEFYEVYDESDVYLGNLYHIKAEGRSYSEETYVEFFLGIAPDKSFTGFRMWDDTETPGKTDDFYLTEYGDSYLGDDIEDDYIIDAIAGSTDTNVIMQDLALDIAIYHVEVYLGQEFARPANVNAQNTDLEAVYTGAVSFNSVYQDYTYNSEIYNIYEALDVSEDVIGYVYYGHADGYGSEDIKFLWSVNLLDTTLELDILNDTESWGFAEEYADYGGSAGYWPDTPWIDSFEGISFSSLLTNPDIDDVAGVSTTTEAMRIVLEMIATYHSDESVGGAG